MEKTDKKTDILIAAEKLFSEFGYEGTSTRQIAKESGANMAMINYYYGSKEGVFMEIMNKRIATHKSALQEIRSLQVSDEEKIMKVIEQYVAKILNNCGFHRMMHRELSLNQRPELYAAIKESIQKNREVIEGILESGVQNGVFRSVDSRMMIATIMGSIHGISTQPDRVIDTPNFDIENNPKHREVLRLRLTSFLQDLIKSFLIIPKNDQ